jgi:hypothetical protein
MNRVLKTGGLMPDLVSWKCLWEKHGKQTSRFAVLLFASLFFTGLALLAAGKMGFSDVLIEQLMTATGAVLVLASFVVALKWGTLKSNPGKKR